ncbi:MAG: hypothetical protein ACXVB6_19770, partial [Mucilaginibacter sp.]
YKPTPNSELAELKNKKAAIDQYAYKHRKEMAVWVKLTGKKKLIKVNGENWPDGTEYIYNVLKDASGHIMLTEQIPYSESGDWYIECRHYFDDSGKTFAFIKRETVFDESVKGGVAVEELLKYYDVNFTVINQSFRLTDKDDNLLRRDKNEFNFRTDEYAIYKNSIDCLLAYHIKLAK